MKRLLIGVDGSPESLRAVWWLAQQADWFKDSEITAVSVYGLEPVATAYGAFVLADDFWEEWRADLQRDLDGAWTKALRDAGFSSLTTHVEEGDPAEVLLRMSAEQAVDLIVVGSRGRGHVRGMFLGSVSHTLALRARCPVMIVPHHGENSSGGTA